MLEATPISQLQPVEDLIDRLSQTTPPVAAATNISLVRNRAVVNLSQWWQDVFDAGWQTVEALLNPTSSNLAYGFRSLETKVTDANTEPVASRSRAKLINLGGEESDRPIVLVVEITAESSHSHNILLQVHATSSLPSGLQLLVLDESGATFMKALARSVDDYIQLGFSGTPGEEFSVRIIIDDFSVTEDFTI